MGNGDESDDTSDFHRFFGQGSEADPGPSPFDDLRRTRNQIENILQMVLGDDGVVVQDFTGRAVYANEAAARILGARTAERVLQTPAEQLLAELEIQDDQGMPLAKELPGAAALRCGETTERTLQFRTPEGRHTWAKVRAVPMRDQTERIVAGVTVFRDVTEQRQAIEFREKLIGVVSHDLKSPLSAITISANTIGRYPDLPHAKMRLVGQRIHAASERALRLVDDLLDLTRIRLGGGIPVERRPVDVQALVNAVAEEVLAANPGRSIRVVCDGGTTVHWDSERIGQALTNLLSNAVAYSPASSKVTLRCQSNAEAVHLAVHNEGASIPPEQLPTLFEPFTRAEHQARGRSLGLGLYIVKSIVEAHGGRITVDSSPGAGTTFTAHLPRDGLAPLAHKSG